MDGKLNKQLGAQRQAGCGCTGSPALRSPAHAARLQEASAALCAGQRPPRHAQPPLPRA
jgi:hypothetical protein